MARLTVRRELRAIALASVLTLASGLVLVPTRAQGPSPGDAQMQARATGGFDLRLPRQGFEATGQVPANYTPQEAAAVAVVRKWIETSNNHDIARHMALIDDDVVYRGDPTAALSHGARGYCASFGFVRNTISLLKIDELYVVGGPSETLVLLKRTDMDFPAADGAALGGYPVPLAVFLRVKNGKITEWYDAPVNKVSAAALRSAGALPAFLRSPGRSRNIPDICMKYPDRSK
jgi:ketosteroid isomerase-like protein